MWPFDDEEDQAPEAPTPAAAPAPAPGVKDPRVRSYLMDKYMKAADDSGVQQARDDARKQQALAMALEGVGQIATAGSAARGGPGVKAGQISGQVGQYARQNVADAQQARKDKMESVLAEDQMEQQEKDRARKTVMQGREDEQYTRQQAELKDMDNPESATSKQYQQLAAKFTGKPIETYAGRSATQLKSLTPIYEKIYGVDTKAKEMAEARADRFAARADAKADRDLRQQELRSNKVNDLVDKDSQALVGQLKGSSRDPIGMAKSKIAAAERVDEMLSHYKDGDKVPPELMHELALSMATMLAPGVPTESTIQGLKAETMQGKLAELASYATGTPTGAGQGEYVKLYRDIVNREHKVANDQYKREVSRLLPGYQRLKKNSPETYSSILRNSGLSEGDFDEFGVYKPQQEAPEQKPRANTLSLGPLDAEPAQAAEYTPPELRDAMILKNKGLPVPPPGHTLLQGPDGSMKAVPNANVDAYLKKGAKKVLQ